jgi:hypothetical protein
MAGSFNFEADPARECGGSAYKSDRTLILLTAKRSTFETTPNTLLEAEASENSTATIEIDGRISRYGAYAPPMLPLSGMPFGIRTRMKEVEEYGTGNCEMV